VTAELGSPELAQALDQADVVIEGSRPRALAQAGIRAGATGAAVWVSITGHGRDRPDRVGFGDDAAVAGGLVAADHRGEPVFCADAVADPLTGMVAALAASAALRSGQRWLLDVALSRVAAAFAGPPLAAWAAFVEAQGEPEPPRRRSAPSPAPGIGAHGPLAGWMEGRLAARRSGSA
jgi:crotonobetainyl-CoA:carnitine CoA-transferase CaiB-like acyl-CoA transferase